MESSVKAVKIPLSIVEMMQQIDFGDIDGLYDPKLERYFLDDDYWRKIVEGDVFFVLGRKGTGKSAIYKWIARQAGERACMISNLSFQSFPFEKFLGLSDDDFSRPNQYQSIWRNIILLEFANLVVTDQDAVPNSAFFELRKYVSYIFGDDLIDLHKQVTSKASKSTAGIALQFLNVSTDISDEDFFMQGFANITLINRRLEKLLLDYLKLYPGDTPFIIQFDQLDDNYTQYQKMQEYHQAIISLFKVVYDINQQFRSIGIRAKVVAYLRSDIYYSIDAFDSESARWDRFRLNLNYSVVAVDDWQHGKLVRLINKRISSSLPEIHEEHAFDIVFNNYLIRLMEGGYSVAPLKYMVHRTFHRPRDLVQFCLKVQERVEQTGRFYFQTIKDAEEQYSLWLLSEVKNEIAVKISELEQLYTFLRQMGSRPFDISSFKAKYKPYEPRICFEPIELLRYLYSVGVVQNVNFRSGNSTEYFSIMRNDQSTLNPDLLVQLHPGFWKGLHTSTYAKRL